LGNVLHDTRAQILTSPAFIQVLEAACNQSLPGCSDCAFQPYCGADPVYHHAVQGDMIGYRPTSGFCKKNMEIIKHLFGLLRTGNSEIQNILWGWITERNLAEMREVVPT